MPTHRQWMGEDRDIEIGRTRPWICSIAAESLANSVYDYLKAQHDLQGANVSDAMALVHGAILEIQVNRELDEFKIGGES